MSHVHGLTGSSGLMGLIGQSMYGFIAASGPTGFTGPTGVTGFTGPIGSTGANSIYEHCCPLHNFLHRTGASVFYDVQNNNFDNLQVYLDNHNNSLPCYILDHTEDYMMAKFLIDHGCVCTLRHKSKLSQDLLGLPTNDITIKIKDIHNIDDAIVYGNQKMIRFYVSCYNYLSKSSMTQPHWNDFVVQDYLLKLLKEKWKMILLETISITKVLNTIIIDYMTCWDKNLFYFSK